MCVLGNLNYNLTTFERATASFEDTNRDVPYLAFVRNVNERVDDDVGARPPFLAVTSS